MPFRHFHRLQHGEFRFPITQTKGLGMGDAAYFADAIQILVGDDFLMAVSGHYGPILCRFARKSIRPPPLARRTVLIITSALSKTLDETNGRSEEIEATAQPILHEALVAELQPLALVCEDNKLRRRNGRPLHILYFHP